jgi:hypothetical protein
LSSLIVADTSRTRMEGGETTAEVRGSKHPTLIDLPSSVGAGVAPRRFTATADDCFRRF